MTITQAVCLGELLLKEGFANLANIDCTDKNEDDVSTDYENHGCPSHNDYPRFSRIVDDLLGLLICYNFSTFSMISLMTSVGLRRP